MRPNLSPLDDPAYALPAYSTMLALGFLCAWLLARRDGQRQGIHPADMYDFTLWMLAWGLIGARVMHVIFDGHFMEYVHMCTDSTLVPAIDPPVKYCAADEQCWRQFHSIMDILLNWGSTVDKFFNCDETRHVCYPSPDCLLAFKAWRGGLAFYGGLIFATAFAWRFLLRHRIPFLKMADIAAYGIALGLFFGRVGCFLNGCCYGKVCPVPPGVVFPRGGAAWRAHLDATLISRGQQALPVHPTQLYQAVLNLGVFAVLYWLVRPGKRRHGEVLAWFLILKAVTRGVVEIWRDDDRGVFFGFISTAQIFGVAMVIAGMAMLWWLGEQRRKEAVTA